MESGANGNPWSIVQKNSQTAPKAYTPHTRPPSSYSRGAAFPSGYTSPMCASRGLSRCPSCLVLYVSRVNDKMTLDINVRMKAHFWKKVGEGEEKGIRTHHSQYNSSYPSSGRPPARGANLEHQSPTHIQRARGIEGVKGEHTSTGPLNRLSYCLASSPSP